MIVKCTNGLYIPGPRTEQSFMLATSTAKPRGYSYQDCGLRASTRDSSSH